MCFLVNLVTTCSSLLISIEVESEGGGGCEGGGAAWWRWGLLIWIGGLGGSPLSKDWRNDDEVGGIICCKGGVELLLGGVAAAWAAVIGGVATVMGDERLFCIDSGGTWEAFKLGSMLCKSIALCMELCSIFWAWFVLCFFNWLLVRIHRRRAWLVAWGLTLWAMVKWGTRSNT